MLTDFENIYNMINDFILNLQKIFSKEEIDRILSQLLFEENPRRMNNLNDYYEDNEEDNSQEQQFKNSILYNFDKIKTKVTGYYNIEGPILFYDNYQHSIPYILNKQYIVCDY